jgi:hypothetical protein
MSTNPPPYTPPGTDPTGNPRPPQNPPPQPAYRKGDDGPMIDPASLNLEGRN